MTLAGGLVVLAIACVRCEGRRLGAPAHQLEAQNVSRPYFCLNSRHVPFFYLLGEQKAGTTTFGKDLLHSGVHSALSHAKELHMFDQYCGFHQRQDRPKREYKALGDWGGVKMPSCHMTETQKSEWMAAFPVCRRAHRAKTDMTPSNLRLHGLPKLMYNLYGSEHPKLHFVVILREPLARFQSGWYWENTAEERYGASFAEYVRVAMPIVDRMRKDN